jgi:3-methyladenine DNA glycosylase/8-oxoguanine DNA glycosylase
MDATRVFGLPGPVDLLRTLRPLRHGSGDPTIRVTADEVLRAARTPEGPATLHLRLAGDRVEARAWGDGAEWALETSPRLLGAEDDPDALITDHPVVGPLHRKMWTLRLCRAGTIMDSLVPTILEQKITSREARRCFAGLVRRYGEPAPGPGELKLPPSADRLATLPYWAFHPLGVAKTRADTLRRVGAVALRLEEAAAMTPADARRRLMSIPGIGAWTAAIVTGTALGDPDAVVVGDFHLPHSVTWALAREPRGDDERMLELLAQFPGQRGRVMRLIAAAGLHPPARIHRRRIHHIHAH